MIIIDFATCGAGTSLPLRHDLWPNKVEFLTEDGNIHIVEAGLGPGHWKRIRIELEKIIGKTIVSDWPKILQPFMTEE